MRRTRKTATKPLRKRVKTPAKSSGTASGAKKTTLPKKNRSLQKKTESRQLKAVLPSKKSVRSGKTVVKNHRKKEDTQTKKSAVPSQKVKKVKVFNVDKSTQKKQRRSTKTSAVDVVEVTSATSTRLPETLPSRIEPTAGLTYQDRNLLGLYLKEISKTPLLSPEAERALALKVYDEKDVEAFQKLVQANLRFVVKIAFEYVRYGARVLDLVQEGNMGLLKAVQDFNPYKEVRLTTYAVWWIRSYIQDFLLRNWSLVRIGTTAAQKKLFYRLKKEQENFERLGVVPPPRAIAHSLNVSEKDVKLMQERLKGGDMSISAPLGGGSEEPNFTLLNKLSDSHELPDSELASQEQAALFKKALTEFQEQLEERDRKIFEARLLSENPKTLLEIGEEYGFSKERARQIEERLKNKLKAFLLEKYPDISLE